MDIIPFDKILEPEIIESIIKWLDGSGILIYPTDTLYGIGGHYMDPSVHDQIDRIKGRGPMPYSMCVSDFQMLTAMTAGFPAEQLPMVKKLLPGKFTLLLEASDAIPKDLLKGHKTVGLRIPQVPSLLELIKISRMPLITTSVNRSGQPPLNKPEDIIRAFNAERILLLDGGILRPSKGSTIVDLTSTPPKLIREGDDFELLSEMNSITNQKS